MPKVHLIRNQVYYVINIRDQKNLQFISLAYSLLSSSISAAVLCRRLTALPDGVVDTIATRHQLGQGVQACAARPSFCPDHHFSSHL